MPAGLLSNPMFIALIWLVVIASAALMGGLWMVYLMKIVMNDDEIPASFDHINANILGMHLQFHFIESVLVNM